MPTHLKQHLGLSILLCLATVFFYGKTRAAEKLLEQPLEKVAIAYSSISGNMAPLWVTYERGFFRKYGLDVQIVFIESGSTTVQSLISKEVAFAQMAGAGVIQSRLRGSERHDDRRISQHPGLSAHGRQEHHSARSAQGKDDGR